MTTLILLCLALIGAGVLLFATQARAMGEMPIMRKMLFAVMASMLLVSGCTPDPLNLRTPAYSPIPLHANLNDPDVAHKHRLSTTNLKIWLLKHCRITRSTSIGRYRIRGIRAVIDGKVWLFGAREECRLALANLKAAEEKLRGHEAEELAKSVVEMQQAVKEKVASFRSKLNLKQYCEVVLDGTAFLREIQEYNENGLGAQVKNARIPDGELHGIIEVAKQGCNPE